MPINISNITQPKLPRDPTLLLHPNIPEGAAGLNPRTMLGQEWWDVERKAAEVKNNYCCYACGIHKSDTKEHWLEGHESYTIDYGKCTITYNMTVSLCNKCHSFIHSGYLLFRCVKREISRTAYLDILDHGVSLLATVGRYPNWMQVAHMHQALAINAMGLSLRLVSRLRRLVDDIPLEAAKPPSGLLEAIPETNEWTLYVNNRRYPASMISSE